MAFSPASFGRSACRSPGVDVFAQRMPAALPKTTRSISEFEPRRLAPCTETQAAFADRHKPGHDRIRIAVFERERFAHVIRGDAAHVVMHGGQHGDRLFRDIHTGKDARGLGDAGQALVNDLRIEMREVQDECDPFRAHAAAFADLDGHRARDDVARCEIFRIRRIALHEALAFGIGEIAAFAAHAFRDQTRLRRRCPWDGTGQTPYPAVAGLRAAPCALPSPVWYVRRCRSK